MGCNILVISGHPTGDSLSAEMARRYAASAQGAGAVVRTLELGGLQFDPVLRAGYRGGQPLEGDLLAAQQAIAWANHLVWAYPTWWGAMPALLKGFIDRVFLPGFAFKYREGSSLWDRLLAGRSAELLVTMDSPPWYYRWVQKQPGHQQMKKTVLEFSGIRPVRVHSFGPVRGSSAQQRERWLARVQALGERAARQRPPGRFA